ncbi:MAG: hypothetical protein QM751_09620 [Paludibacteraceae bacterium]
MDKLSDWIQKEKATEKLLALCHTTRWRSFEKIIQTDILSTKFSKFPEPNPFKLKEDQVVYLFYGLPFYIYEIGDGKMIKSQATEEMPIGLIFKPETVKNVDRFYPFDTGALFSEKYKGILNISSESDYKVFEVPISGDSEIKKFIKRYYRRNENYCIGDVENIKPENIKEENLLRLLNFSSDSEIDLRHRAIEIHSLKDIILSNNLLSIILPYSRTKKYPQFIREIKSKYPNVSIRTYTDFIRFSAESTRTALLIETLNFYKNNKSFNLKLS